LSAGPFASNGLAYVEDFKHGYINEAGKIVIPPQFKDAETFEPNGLARVKQNNKWGWINEAGEMVIPVQFEEANPFASNGLARVKQYDEYGYINEAGEMVIPPQFKWAGDFSSNGLAYVYTNGKYGHINGAGEMVIPPQFYSEYRVEMSFGFDGLAPVEESGMWGYINEAGEMVIPLQFTEADPFTIIFRSEVERAKQIQEKAAEDKRIADKARQKAEQQAKWRAAGLCQHCGGDLKGLFSKKCVSCGKPKDY
jgi:hypothetical protein